MNKSQIKFETITTDEYKKFSQPQQIDYGFHPTIFGNCLIGITDDKICYLSFPKVKEIAIQEMQRHWSKSNLIEKAAPTFEILEKIFNNEAQEFSLLLKGTPFQINVWQALLATAYGTTTSYEAIAQKSGHMKAVRAAASAVACNNISYLVPCHRVIKKSGALHKFRWGTDIKRQMLEYESTII
jgi:AraC family transcriptional regulator of adaptative response/methylated-DNA-[protein]-cysteine methyltransferase